MGIIRHFGLVYHLIYLMSHHNLIDYSLRSRVIYLMAMRVSPFSC